jgi:hypothetical protein
MLIAASMVGPLGGTDGVPGAPTTYVRDVDGGRLGAVMEIQKCPPSTQKTSMMGPLVAVMKIREHPPSMQKCQWRASWVAVMDIQERPPSTQKMSTTDPLGGGAGGPGAPTTQLEDINGGPLSPPGGGSGLDPSSVSVL